MVRQSFSHIPISGILACRTSIFSKYRHRTAFEDHVNCALDGIVKKHGRFDYLISNSCYNMIDQLSDSRSQDLSIKICKEPDRTLYLVNFIMPYTRSDLDRLIICIPPKKISQNQDAIAADNDLSAIVEEYSDCLQARPTPLDIKLTVIGNEQGAFSN